MLMGKYLYTPLGTVDLTRMTIVCKDYFLWRLWWQNLKLLVQVFNCDIMIKAGVAGVGRMGGFHARNYKDLGCLKAVFDLHEETARSMAEKYGCSYYSDFEEFIINSGVEAISIATPTTTHFEISKRAMEQGIHILIEKPICDEISKGQELVDTAKEHDVILAVGHIERFNTMVESVKSAVDKRKIGNIISYEAVRVGPYPKRISDVGVIMDTSIHDVDLARYIINKKVKRVSSMANRNKHPTHEDLAHILLSFHDEAIANIHVSWNRPHPRRSLYITGDAGYLEADLLKGKLSVFTFNPETAEYEMETHTPHREEPLKKEILDFFNAIEKAESPLVTGEEALKALEIVKACIRSAQDGTTVTL